MTTAIKRVSCVLGVSLLLPGVLMGYQGCSRAGGGLATWITGDAADGTVTAIRSYGGSSPPLTSPRRDASVITFTAAGGEVVSFEHPVRGSSPPFAKGERVRVFYDPDEPEDAVAPGGLPMLVFGWGFVAAAGVALVVTGLLVLLVGALPWGVRGRRTSS